MAACNSDCPEPPGPKVPLCVITGQPCFNDPWLSTHNVPWTSVERPRAVLDIKNGSYRDCANALIARIDEICDSMTDFYRPRWVKRPRSLRIILMDHDDISRMKFTNENLRAPGKRTRRSMKKSGACERSVPIYGFDKSYRPIPCSWLKTQTQRSHPNARSRG
jgi:hypothetical protein